MNWNLKRGGSAKDRGDDGDPADDFREPAAESERVGVPSTLARHPVRPQKRKSSQTELGWKTGIGIGLRVFWVFEPKSETRGLGRKF